MKPHATFALVVLAATLGACAGAGPLTQGNISPLYHPADLSYAASRGTVPVVVFDGTGDQSLQNAALAGLRDGASRGNFVLAPQAPSAGYKVVMLFNGPPTTGDALCGVTASPTRTSGSATPLTAAFCADDRMLTEVEAYGARAEDDDAVRRLVRQIAADLFPSRDAGIHDIKPE